MNLQYIKSSGYRIGLESELAVQQRGMAQNIKELKFGAALQSANYCVELLTELVKVTTPDTTTK